MYKEDQQPHHRSRSMIIRKHGTDMSMDNLSQAIPLGEGHHPMHLAPNHNQNIYMTDHLNKSDMPIGMSMAYLDPSSAVNSETDQIFPPNIDAFSKSPRNSIRRTRNSTMRDEIVSEGMDDHFDQYCLDNQISRKNHPMRLFSEPNSWTRTPSDMKGSKISSYDVDWTPDSGVSESMDNVSGDMFPSGRPGTRRSTLPNLSPDDIIKMVTNGYSQSKDSDKEVEVTIRKQHQNNVSANSVQATPQRTASLYTSPSGSRNAESKNKAAAQRTPVSVNKPLKRKKSLPDIGVLAASNKCKIMTRAEAYTLSTQRKQEIRQQREDEEARRNNPLLHLFRPDVRVSS